MTSLTPRVLAAYLLGLRVEALARGGGALVRRAAMRCQPVQPPRHNIHAARCRLQPTVLLLLELLLEGSVRRPDHDEREQSKRDVVLRIAGHRALVHQALALQVTQHLRHVAG